MQQNLRIAGPNLGRGFTTFHVHAANCADLKKERYRRAEGYSCVYFSKEDVVLDAYSEIIAERDDGSTWEDLLDEFTFFPCVKVPLRADTP